MCRLTTLLSAIVIALWGCATTQTAVFNSHCDPWDDDCSAPRDPAAGARTFELPSEKANKSANSKKQMESTPAAKTAPVATSVTRTNTSPSSSASTQLTSSGTNSSARSSQHARKSADLTLASAIESPKVDVKSDISVAEKVIGNNGVRQADADSTSAHVAPSAASTPTPEQSSQMRRSASPTNSSAQASQLAKATPLSQSSQMAKVTPPAQSTQLAQRPTSKEEGKTKYLIGPGDQIQIFVWRNPEVSVTVPVRPDGKISTPLVEDMIAVGKTPTILARDIEKVLETYIRDPVVTVIVTGFGGPYSQQIRVIGQATRPQTLPYRDNMSLLDVVIAVGGLTEYASGNKATIVRKVKGEQKQIRVRLDDLVNKGDISANFEMRPGDILIIPESWF